MELTENLQSDWESGKINKITDVQDFYDDDKELCHTVKYYPEFDVTIWMYTFFEGYINDDMIDQFDKITKGRASWKDIEYFMS